MWIRRMDGLEEAKIAKLQLTGTQSFFLSPRMHYKAVLTLIGGILIHLTLGTLYTASNLTSYVISYLHVIKRQPVR